jgi:hypothetical protein
VPESAESAAFRTLAVVTDAPFPLLVHPPTVHLHASVMAALRLPDFAPVTVTWTATGRTCSAWAVANADDRWHDCATPWHRTARLSRSAWRSLGSSDPGRSGERLQIRIPQTRLPVKGVLVEQVIGNAEMGVHREDADRIGIAEWAIVNYGGIPAALRVRLLDSAEDKGAVRLPLYGRVLLGIPSWAPGLHPEILVSPYPRDADGRPLVMASVLPGATGLRRSVSRAGVAADRLLAALLHAPSATLRTVEATPGEDQALSVRLPAELFPLIGTDPGQQVYVEWGPGNRAIATALPRGDDEDGPPPTRILGDRLADVPGVPPHAQIKIGADTRAALGIPRQTVVTVRRRISPLITGRLNELIVPVTGLFIAVAAKIHASVWLFAAATAIILALLLTPLRVRRPRRGRIR